LAKDDLAAGEVREYLEIAGRKEYTWVGAAVKEWRRLVGMPVVGSYTEMHILMEHLLFHSSWDWIMPVVERIESLENRRFGLWIDPHGVEIYDYIESPERTIVASFKWDSESKISLVWAAVVNFIKWYKEITNE